MIDSRVQNISDRVISGVGIRVFKGCRCISGCTTDIYKKILQQNKKVNMSYIYCVKVKKKENR